MSFASKVIAASALMILLGIGVLSFRSALRDERDREWVTHTHLVVESLEEILIDINQAETGQRGHILTADGKYRKPFEEGTQNVQRDVEKFRELTTDNPSQQEAV